jgi:hypothetical protein
MSWYAHGCSSTAEQMQLTARAINMGIEGLWPINICSCYVADLGSLGVV